MRTIILLLFLSFNLTLTAQNYDFGKVSKEEIEEKFNPLDTSANATYLYKYRRTYFKYRLEEGFEQITDVHERIKIYNKEGFDYATKKIDLYKSGNEYEEVTSLKAYTYNIIDGKVEETKLKKDGIFKTEDSKYQNQTKFTLPNIKEGTVIEYKYSVNSPFYWNVEDFEFQHEIPIKKLEAIFEAPEYYVFKSNSKGFFNVTAKNEKRSDKLSYKVEVPLSENRAMDATIHYRSGELEYFNHISKYNLSNIPSLKEEPYVNNIDNYRSAIKYELSYTNFPQTPLKYFSTTWEDVVKTIYDSESFGKELEKSGYYEKDIDALIMNVSNAVEKASLIYNHVKSKIKWNGYYGKFTNEGVKKAYLINTGNVAEMNLMLTSMLRYAGLNANPVLISTRQNGIPLFPTIDGYNYVISAIETPEGTMLLDATSNYGVPNILPLRTLNWEGRIVRKDKSTSTINLYPKQQSKSVVNLLVNLANNGSVEGNMRTIKTNHDAMIYRDKYIETEKSQFLETLENRYHGMEISEFDVKNDKDVSKPIIESFKFSLESQADIIDDKIYFSPLFFLRINENPFRLETREFPVDYGYPSSTKYMINIDLPEGYKVEVIPKTIAMALPDNLGAFKYNISASETKVHLVVDSEINQPIISPIYYETLKAYFSKLIEKEAEQIVLNKV